MTLVNMSHSAQNQFTFKNINNPCNSNRRRAPKRDLTSDTQCKSNKRVKLNFGQFSNAVAARNSQILNRISELAKEIKESNININALSVSNTSDILAFLNMKYGFALTSNILATLRHVPSNFPKRDIFVKNIISTLSDDSDLLQFVDEIMPSLSKLACGNDSVHIELDDNLLWKVTEKHSEPHNMFLVPPVDECIECHGNIHVKRTGPCTVYTLESGPVPAMKATFRCNKCAINYHIDGYSNENGTFWYTEQSLLRRASKFAYCTEDVFQWICESR